MYIGVVISKWYHLKSTAIKLRRRGNSLREVEKTLGIPKSTLSSWFKVVVLSKKQILRLADNRIKHLNEARKLAVKWHNQQKEIRLRQAEDLAEKTLNKINTKDRSVQELALAMLYLGEGLKTGSGTGIGNSDPVILKYFISQILMTYGIDPNKIKCSLHLRADQDPEKIKKYWSRELGLPLKNFMSVSVDLRTKGRPTYTSYNGVCVVNCGNIATQRKLLYLARKFCCQIANEWAVSSAGRASA